MIALVTGGASSGKSAYAEDLTLTLPGPYVYAASMRHGDGETEARIERHRAMRAGKGFTTLELVGGDVPPWTPDGALGPTVLVEDLGNVVANGIEDVLEVLFTYPNVVVVGNEVGSDGIRYDDFTRAYIERIGALACTIGAAADVVVEVVAGVPHVVKGAVR